MPSFPEETEKIMSPAETAPDRIAVAGIISPRSVAVIGASDDVGNSAAG
ncbi:hypothetical protein ACFQY5_08190 [Paeniroseomonas aquatica]